MRRWAPAAIVVALLAATAVAFATTERQKLEKTPFSVRHVDEAFSPKVRAAMIELSFRRPHLLTLQILDSHDRAVATLASELRVEPGIHDFRWDGRDVRDGAYRPKVTLDTGREFTLPNPIQVDSVAPTAKLISYRPRVLRDGVKPRVLISYRVSEPAHVLLYVNGRQEVRGGAKALTSQIEWFARRNGTPLGPGAYGLRLAAVDLAGNVGPRTGVFVVRIR